MAKELTIFRSLLKGNHIMPRQGKHPFCVYDAKRNPLLHVSNTMFKQLNPLIKKDKKGRMTLNLTKVRQLHGNEIFKQEYKAFKSKTKNTSHETQRI